VHFGPAIESYVVYKTSNDATPANWPKLTVGLAGGAPWHHNAMMRSTP